MINSEHIRKYLDGELSPQEMQALEKAALEDPFLADAIDGITESRTHPVPFEVAVSELQKKLAERVMQKERKKAIPWIRGHWRAAASVFLVVTLAGVTVTLINRNSQKPVIAKKNSTDSIKEQAVIAPSVIQTDSGSTIVNSAESASINYTEPVIKRGRLRAGQKKSIPEAEETGETDRSSAKQQTVATAPVVLAESEKSAAGKKDLPDSIMPEKDRLSAVPPVQDGLKSKAAGLEIVSSGKKKPEHFIQGQVLDEKGKPVNGAAVSLAKAKDGTITDPEGYFRLYVKKQDSAFHLQIQSVGYNSISAFWNRDSTSNIYRLQPSSTSLNEVVVIGYGSKKSDDEVTDDVIINDHVAASRKSAENKKVEPRMGWEAFNQYISKNKNIQTSDSLLKGVEIISFEVDQKGSLSSFRILQSVSPAHDMEIIKLIRSVSWKILKGKRQRRIISVEYN